MAEYRAVVLTRGRPDSVGTDTLNTISAMVGKVPVHVLVCEDDWDSYAPVRDAWPSVDFRPAPAGLENVNQLIIDTWPGEWLLRLDDDIIGIFAGHGGSWATAKLVGQQYVPAMVNELVQTGEAAGVSLVGLAPVANSMFLNTQFLTGLYFACGGVLLVKPIAGSVVGCTAKDDYERTLQHYTQDGAVGRAQWLTPKRRATRKTPGGLSAQYSMDQRRAAETADVAFLKQQYPGLVHDKPARDGFPEIALRLPAKGKR